MNIPASFAKVEKLLDMFLTGDLPKYLSRVEVAVTSDGYVVIETDKGFYLLHRDNTSRVQKITGSIVGKYNAYINDALEALMILGLITKEEHDETIQYFNDWEVDKRIGEDLQRARAFAEKLGMALVPKE